MEDKSSRGLRRSSLVVAVASLLSLMVAAPAPAASHHVRARHHTSCRAAAAHRPHSHAKRHASNCSRRHAVAHAASDQVVNAPSNLSAKAGNQQVVLAWRGSTSPVAGYRVFRNGKWIARTSSTTYMNTGLTDGIAYRFYVVAYNSLGSVSVPSTTVSATPLAPLPLPPGPVPSSGIQSVTCGWGTFTDLLSLVLPSGCWRPFANSSWLNTPLPANPTLVSNSASLVSNMMSSGTGNGDGTVHAIQPIPAAGNDYSHPYYFSKSTDPLYTISCTRNCNLAGQNVNGQQVRIPCGAMPANGGDLHLAVIDQVAGVEWDFWDVQTNLSSCSGGTLTVGLAGQVSINGNGAGSCADAACVALTAGIIREQELAAGQIDHALFMVDHTCNGTTVFPGWTPNTCGGTNSTAPAVGQWFKLNLTPSQIQALPNIASWQKTVLTAMSTYGMFVGDQGSNGAFELQTESPATYMGRTNPWNAWATSEAGQPNNNISYSGGTLALNIAAGLPSNFWATNLQAINSCVIQRTCTSTG